MKMAGARVVERGWPEHGFVEVWQVCDDAKRVGVRESETEGGLAR